MLESDQQYTKSRAEEKRKKKEKKGGGGGGGRREKEGGKGGGVKHLCNIQLTWLNSVILSLSFLQQ